ncbi:hypothetical protein B0O99DRAFT_612037 [Bisporella sp. PMI_857]|nr:hypothetical protein B0O99DRAFT_612037 [Bisporella sp. PMI_857]
MPAQSPPPQEYARLVIICILLFFVYSSPEQNGGPGYTSRDYVAERNGRVRHNLDVLNHTRWQDFSPKGPAKPDHEAARYLNLTGFREDDDYVWERLDTFKKRSKLFSDEALSRLRLGEGNGGDALPGEIYENVTGVVVGKWVRYSGDLARGERHRTLNLSEISPGIDWAYQNERFWTRNVTGLEGRLVLRLDEKDGHEMDFVGNDASNIQPDLTGGLVREIAATMTLQDQSSNGDGYEFRLHGVHWPKQGTILLTTTSEKFAGIFGLPHLTLSKDYFTSSQRILNATLGKAVKKMEKAIWFDPSNPWSSTPDAQGDGMMPSPHCEYVVAVQVYPMAGGSLVSSDPKMLVHQIEQELRFPNGAPLPIVPRLQLTTVILSPDCGFMLESKGPPDFSPKLAEHLVGKKQEVWLHNVHDWLLVFGAVMFGQVMLMKIQSKEASTPSTTARVSLYSIGMMLMVDALIFSALSLLSATAPNIFPSALLASFAGLMSVALEARFASVVYNVQEPERRERLRAELATEAARAPAQPTPTATSASSPQTASANTSIPVITAAGADLAPPRSASTATELPIIVPSDQDIDAEMAENVSASSSVPIPVQNTTPLLPTTNRPTTTPPPQASSSFGSMYVKFVLTLTLVLFVSLSSIAWPVWLRTAYIHLLSMIYLSFWIPQIRRNILRNCRKALLWKFVIGQSILRLLPFAYFYLREDNIMFARSDWKAFAVYVGWVWIQIWILAAQEILGPRWGLPKTWTDEGWDYHPILREDNVEAGGLPIGLMQIPGSPTLERVRTGDDKKNSTMSVDCAICMQVLEVPVVASGTDAGSSGAAGGVVGMLARRQYMVTPCRHVFHSPCLEGWMRFRLQCPICRETLPAL